MKHIALLTCMVMALSGCFFDDSSSGTGEAQISGRAAKGVLSSALVTVERYQDKAFQYLTETITDADGMYSLSDLPAGILRLTVSPQEDGSTLMLCDSQQCGNHSIDTLAYDSNLNNKVDFGEWGPVPLAFEMQALAVVEQGAIQIQSISPLTHMAAAWAQNFPEGLSESVVQQGLQRIADIFLIDSDFASVFAPVPTDLGLDEEELRQAMLLAAFATIDAGEVGTAHQAMAESFIAYGGQLPVSSSDDSLFSGRDASLESFFNSITTISTVLQAVMGDDFLAIRDAYFENMLTAYAESTITTVNSLDSNVNEEDLAAAKSVIDELDYYLSIAGIDEQGQFLATQRQQVEWLYRQETLTFAGMALQAAIPTVLVSINGDAFVSADDDQDGLVDLALVLPGFLPEGASAIYNYQAEPRTLNMTFDSLDHALALTAEVPMLTTGTQIDYAVDASLSNLYMVGELAGTLKVNLNDTDLNGFANSQNLDDLLAALETVDVFAEIQGDASLTNIENGKQLYGAIHARGALDVAAFNDAEGIFLSGEIISGEAISPNGDRIYTLADQSGFVGQFDEDASAVFAFGFEAFGMPAMEFAGSGSIENAGDTAQSVIDTISEAGQLDAELVTALFGYIPDIIENLEGEARLTIPEDGKQWLYTLSENRVDVSLTNDSTVAVTVHLSSIAGGYLSRNGHMIGTFTIDWQNLGVHLLLADGTRDSYLLGPITDFLPEEIIQVIMSLFGGQAAV